MQKLTSMANYAVLGVTAWGCFTILTGFAKTLSGPSVVGWRARVLGFVAATALPVSWAFGYACVVVVAMTNGGARLEQWQLVIVASDIIAVVGVFGVMHHLSRKWARESESSSQTSPEPPST